MGLLFREHPKAQPGGVFWRSPGSNLACSLEEWRDHSKFHQILLVGIKNILFLIYGGNNKSPSMPSSNHTVSTRSFYNLLITS